MFSRVYVFSFTTGLGLQGRLFGPQPRAMRFTRGYRKRLRVRPEEHPQFSQGSNGFEVRSPATFQLRCGKSVDGTKSASIPDTNMEKSLFGANIRANIILPERNHGEHP